MAGAIGGGAVVRVVPGRSSTRNREANFPKAAPVRREFMLRRSWSGYMLTKSNQFRLKQIQPGSYFKHAVRLHRRGAVYWKEAT